jgi:hypothetical protein
MIRVITAAGKANRKKPRIQKPMFEGKFANTNGSQERMLGSSTSLIAVPKGIKAEKRNTRPITKAPIPSSKRCKRSSQGAVFQLCLAKAKLIIARALVIGLIQSKNNSLIHF